MTNTAKKKVNHLPEYDARATLEQVRARYGSVAEYVRQMELNPQMFYSAVRGDRGRTRKGSVAAQVIYRLDEQGLLVKV